MNDAQRSGLIKIGKEMKISIRRGKEKKLDTARDKLSNSVKRAHPDYNDNQVAAWLKGR